MNTSVLFKQLNVSIVQSYHHTGHNQIPSGSIGIKRNQYNETSTPWSMVSCSCLIDANLGWEKKWIEKQITWDHSEPFPYQWSFYCAGLVRSLQSTQMPTSSPERVLACRSCDIPGRKMVWDGLSLRANKTFWWEKQYIISMYIIHMYCIYIIYL